MNALRFGLTLLLELIPLFLLISTVVHLVVERMTPERIRTLLGGRSRWLGVPIAAAVGALTPFCSCSTVPMVGGMRAAGIPVVSLVTFLIASPLINPVAVALLGSAIGAEYAVLYTVAGLVFAAGAGLVVERWHGSMAPEAVPVASAASACASTACAPAPRPLLALAVGNAGPGGLAVMGPAVSACCSVPEPTSARRLAESVGRAGAKALEDMRKLAVPLLIAVAVGALIHGYAPADLLGRLAGPGQLWAIPAAAILGVPVYASIIVLLPLGTTLLAKGVGVGAVTAFLMGASGFSLPEGILLSRVLPRALLLRILAAFSVGVILIGYLFQAVAG